MSALQLCSNIEVIQIEQNQKKIMIDSQMEVETFLNQESNNIQVVVFHSIIKPLNCDQLMLSILSIQLSFIVKDFSEQTKILKLQIHKQIQDLINHKIDFYDELLQMLLCQREQVLLKYLLLFKEPKSVVDLQYAIKHLFQNFFQFGGRLRREKVFRQLNFKPKTPECFAKTKKWIKKLTEGQQDQLELKQSQTIERNRQIDAGFEEL